MWCHCDNLDVGMKGISSPYVFFSLVNPPASRQGCNTQKKMIMNILIEFSPSDELIKGKVLNRLSVLVRMSHKSRKILHPYNTA